MAEIIEALPRFLPHLARLDLLPDEKSDKAHQYRWASGDPGRVDFLKSLGYEIVYTKDRTTGQDIPRMVDNSVLMRCPKEQWEKRQGMRQALARQLLEAPRKRVQSIGEQAGVEVTDQTREYRAPMEAVMNEKPEEIKPGEGVITREQLGMNGVVKEEASPWNPHLGK
jgi:hypothetical protein